LHRSLTQARLEKRLERFLLLRAMRLPAPEPERGRDQRYRGERRQQAGGEVECTEFQKAAVMKIVIIVLLIAVVASLFSGLYFVYKDKGTTNRAVISLTVRIALSVLVFAILIVSYYFGWIPERGLK
jgi:hypothetical protein